MSLHNACQKTLISNDLYFTYAFIQKTHLLRVALSNQYLRIMARMNVIARFAPRMSFDEINNYYYYYSKQYAGYEYMRILNIESFTWSLISSCLITSEKWSNIKK